MAVLVQEESINFEHCCQIWSKVSDSGMLLNEINQELDSFLDITLLCSINGKAATGIAAIELFERY